MISLDEVRSDFYKLSGSETKRRDTRKIYTLPNGYRGATPLYAHQYTGIKALVNSKVYGLFDECGIGKSIELLYSVLDLIEGGYVECGIVVCKRSHVTNWLEGQIRTHAPDIEPYVVAGMSPHERARPWPLDRKLYLVNYELLALMLCTKDGKRSAAELRKNGSFLEQLPHRRTVVGGTDARNLITLLRSRKCAIVLDESQGIKNVHSNVARILHGLSYLAPCRYIATGTPVAERPDDVWSQIYFLDHGELLGSNYFYFLQNYAVYAENRYGQRWIVKYKNLLTLQDKLKTISIRRRKEDCLDLPEKILNVQKFEAKGMQARLLRKIREELVSGLRDARGQKILRVADETGVMGRVQMMLRACAVPWVVDEDVTESAKLDELLDVLEEIGADQLIVWAVHKDVCVAASAYLERQKISSAYINGDVPQKRRDAILDAFRAGEVRVLVATMATLRESVTLTNAHHAFYLELDFSRLNFYQSQNRQHRIGQTDTCILHIPLIERTTDLYVWGSLLSKNVNADASVDGKLKQGFLDIREVLNILGENR